MKLSQITLILIIWSVIMVAQEKKAYQLYNADLKPVEYSELVKKAGSSDMVFFGETHNSVVAHSLELDLVKDLFTTAGSKLVLGSEMFEADNQMIIDEYLAGYFDDSKFEADARLWPNYKTDYKPILKFAKERKLKFIATNIPRRYASMVNNGGFQALDKLSNQAKSYIAKLPVKFDQEATCYKTMIKGMSEMGKMGHKQMDPVNLAKAQAIKDATMAQFILKNYSKGNIFFHFNGSFHSYNKEGIVLYINYEKKDLKILNITIVEADDITKPEEGVRGKADFIIVIPKDSPKSYK
jgi:uncharacterized iron-regulated protein